MSKKSITLSEKLNALLGVNGNDGDESNNEVSEDDEVAAPRVAEFNDEEYELPEARATEFRKKNVKLLSEQSDRYKGRISSRKDSSSGSEEELIGDDESTIEEETKELEENSNTSDDDDNYSGDEDAEQSMEEQSDEEASSNDDANGKKQIFNEQTKEAEILKGLSVQNQLQIWERLLEVRIHSQKLLNKANLLPDPQTSTLDEDNNQLQSIKEETNHNLCKLLRTYVELQNVLTKQFPELNAKFRNASQSKISLENEISTGPPPIKRFAAHLEDRHVSVKEYRNSVLLKWDDRTKLLTPGAGSKRKAEESFDIIRKIENALINRNTLIEKSQTLKTADSCRNRPENADETPRTHSVPQREEESKQLNANVYDDSDFYHQQLRELIEYKANNSTTTAEMTKQYIELQKLRQKMKKKVDQRASKGRKLRYIVHNKLINFMAPDDGSSFWTDEAKDELYKSLFKS